MEKDVVKRSAICFAVSMLWTIAVGSYISKTDVVAVGDMVLFFAFFILTMQEKLYCKILNPNKRDIVISAFFSLLLLVGKTIYTEHDLMSFCTHPVYNLVIFVVTAHLLAVFTPYVLETLYSSFSGKLPEIGLGRKQLIVFFAIVTILDVVAFLVFFPGVGTYDYFTIYFQAIGERSLDNQQPILYTIFWKALFYVANLLHNIYMANVIYSIIQIVVVNITFCYVLTWLRKKKAPSVLILLSGIYYIINPIFWLFSFVTTKDVYFGCCLIVFLTSLYDLMTTEKRAFTCFISCLLACFFRNNMIYAMVVLFLMVIIIAPARIKKLELISILPALIISIVTPVVVYPALDIHYTDSSEFLSIPIQQIAAVYAKEGCFSEEEKATINEYLSCVDEYNYRFADPVKNSLNNGLYDENKKPFWDIYFKGLKRSPITYLCAALDTNVELWYPASTGNDEFAQREYVEIGLYPDYFSGSADAYYTHGIFEIIRPFYYAMARLESKLSTLPLISNFLSLSFPFYSMVLCLIIMIRRGKKYETVIPVALLILEATYLLGPVTNYRYLHPMYIMVPVYFAMAIKNNDDSQDNAADSVS